MDSEPLRAIAPEYPGGYLEEEEEQGGSRPLGVTAQGYRRLPEEGLRGELFGLRPLLNTRASPEDEEEEEEERGRSFGLAVTALALQAAAQGRRRVVSCLDLK